MQVYPIVGSQLTLAADNIESAAGLAVPGSGGYPDDTSKGGGLSVLSSRSVTKDGTTRLLFEVAMGAILPTEQGETQLTKVSNIKVHTVVTVPKAAADMMRREATDPGFNGVHSVQTNLNYILAVLNAIVTGKSLASLPAASNDSPVAKGVFGARPVDTYNGVYGQAS